jgi:hypothetical protein
LERNPAEGRGNIGLGPRCYPDFRRLALSLTAYVTGRFSDQTTAVASPNRTRQKPLRTCNSVPRKARGHLGVAERRGRSLLIASTGPRSCGLPFQQVPRGSGATWGSAKAGRRASGASESVRPSARVRVRVRSVVRTIPCTCGKVPPEAWKPNGSGPNKVVSR